MRALRSEGESRDVKTTYVIDANRRIIARHKGAHDEAWGDELRRHYDSAIASASFPAFKAPCSVVLMDPDPFSANAAEIVIGEALPS